MNNTQPNIPIFMKNNHLYLDFYRNFSKDPFNGIQKYMPNNIEQLEPPIFGHIMSWFTAVVDQSIELTVEVSPEEGARNLYNQMRQKCPKMKEFYRPWDILKTACPTPGSGHFHWIDLLLRFRLALENGEEAINF